MEKRIQKRNGKVSTPGGDAQADEAGKGKRTEEIREIRGLLKMTTLGQMLMEDGIEIGIQKGEGRVNQLILRLTAEKRYSDLERAARDRAFQEMLYEQYGL